MGQHELVLRILDCLRDDRRASWRDEGYFLYYDETD